MGLFHESMSAFSSCDRWIMVALNARFWPIFDDQNSFISPVLSGRFQYFKIPASYFPNRGFYQIS
jgi:hypothetical protein